MTAAERPTSTGVVALAPPFAIRHKLPSDLEDDYRWRRDPELAAFDGRPPLDQDREAFMQQALFDLRYPSPWHESFSIVDDTGTHVGNVMYYNVTADRECAEVGMMLAEPSLRGHGHGTRLAVAFTRFLWQSYPFRRLVAHMLEWNERAARAFERAGYERTARVYRAEQWLLRLEARREWWLLWDGEGRFDFPPPPNQPPQQG